MLLNVRKVTDKWVASRVFNQKRFMKARNDPGKGSVWIRGERMKELNGRENGMVCVLR